MRTLSSKVKDLPDVVTSAVVVESAARFRDNAVVQLLDPQSAMNHLLSYSTSFHYLLHSFLFCIDFLSYFLIICSVLSKFYNGHDVTVLAQVIGSRSRWMTLQGTLSTAV